MKRLLAFALILFCAFSAQSQTLSELGNNKSIKLFNGKNLDGWYQITDGKGPETNLFSAENETIHVYPSQTPNSTQSFGAIITNNEYENYVLSLEYKWGENKFKPRDESVRDAGVLIHLHGESVVWPAGIECQIQEGDAGDLWIVKSQASSLVDTTNRNYNATGGVIATLGTPSQQYNRFFRSYCWEQPGWNKVVLVVKGDDAKFYINGHLVNEAIGMKAWDAVLAKWVPLTKGKILLQAEGSEVFYRNVILQGLKDE